MAPIDDALDDLNSQKTPQISQTAKKYGVDRSTLSRRFNGLTKPRVLAIDQTAILTKQQEITLVKYISQLVEEGLPPTNAMVRNFAWDISKKEPGKNWVYRFIERHKDQLESRFMSAMDSSRKKADNWFDYKLYFELVSNL
jgi:membrane-bound lytic murein transglycosylase B